MKPTQAHQYLAQQLLADAQHGTYFGDRKVFLGTIPGVDLQDAECLLQLDELRRMGLVVFARADLVAAMDQALVSCSLWCPMPGVQYHFVVVA